VGDEVEDPDLSDSDEEDGNVEEDNGPTRSTLEHGSFFSW